jgi:hypothetical protein
LTWIGGLVVLFFAAGLSAGGLFSSASQAFSSAFPSPAVLVDLESAFDQG